MTIAQTIFEQLKNDIVRMRVRPGDRISEAEIAKRFHISRQPVREAFIQLAARGLVRITPQRPTTVSGISVVDVRAATFVRVALETAVARRAAERCDAALAAALEATIEAQRRAAAEDDLEEFHVSDERFHWRLCVGAEVEHVWRLIDEQKTQMDRMRYLTLGFNKEVTIAQHEQVLASVVARDPDAAAAAMQRHLSTLEDLLPELVARFGDVFAEDPEPPEPLTAPARA